MNDKVNCRTCVCCKTSKSKFEMVRIAVVGDSVICDTTYKSGGRGFYICSDECLSRILSSKKFSKISNMISDKMILKDIEGMLKSAYKS